jgi:hypothetical protein
LAEAEVIWLNTVSKKFLHSYHLRWLAHMLRLEIIGAVKDPHFIFTARQAYNIACELNDRQLIQETLNFFKAQYSNESWETILVNVCQEGIKPKTGEPDMGFYYALVDYTLPPRQPQQYKLPHAAAPPPYNRIGFGPVRDSRATVSVALHGYGSVFGRNSLSFSSSLHPEATPFFGQGKNSGRPPVYPRQGPPQYLPMGDKLN